MKPTSLFSHPLAIVISLWSATACLALDPTNVRMDSADDTAGASTSDAITYVGAPLFRWTAPSGTVLQYQWAVTASDRDPWSSSGAYRLQQGYTASTSARPVTMADAQYKFWVQAEGSSAGQWGNWVARVFRIDTTLPTTPTGLTNPGGADAVNDSTPNVTWTASDAGSGVWTHDVQFTKDSTTYLFTSGDTTLDSVDFGATTLSSGQWAWKVRAIDVAGNTTGWSATKNLKVDTTGPTNPTSFGSTPAKNLWTTDNTVEVSWSGAADAVSGLAGYYSRWDTSASTTVSSSDAYTANTSGAGAKTSSSLADSASWYFHIRYRDQVGNLATSTAHWGPFKIDRTVPTAVGGLGMDGSYDTFGASASDGITYHGNPKFGWSAASDGSGSGIAQYQWAVTAPSVTDPSAQARLRDHFTTSLYAFPNDDGSSNLPDGPYKFWVQAQDSAGNWGPWTSVLFRIDTTPPTAPAGLTNPADLTPDTTPNVTWNVSTDAGSGLWTYSVRFVKGVTTHTFASSDPSLDDVDFGGVTLADGVWTWDVRAVDVAGNSTWSGTRTLTIGSPPAIPTGLGISAADDTPAENNTDNITYIGNPQFQWNAVLNATEYQWAVTSTDKNPYTDPADKLKFGWTSGLSVRPGDTWPGGAIPQGPYKFWVQAKSGVGLWGEWAAVPFTIDWTPPPPPEHLMNPTDPTTDSTPNVTWNPVEDLESGSGVWTYDVLFTNGGTTHTFVSGDTTLDDVDFEGLALTPGTWTWQVRAIDVAGNDGLWSASQTLTVHSGAYTITIHPADHRQTIEGFGGAFAMWGFNPTPSLVEDVVTDLNVSIVRLHADGARFDQGVLVDGYTPGPGTTLGTWGRSAEWTGSFAAAKAAAATGVSKFVLSFWYPPSDFLDASRRWSATADQSQQWASAIALRASEYAQGNGADSGLWQANPAAEFYISLQNEPNLWDSRANGGVWAFWTPSQLREFLPALRAALAARFGADAAKFHLLGPELTGVEPWPAEFWTYSALAEFKAALQGGDRFCYHTYDSYRDAPVYGVLDAPADPPYEPADEIDPGFAGHPGASTASLTARLTELHARVGNGSWMTETTGPQWNGAHWHTLGWRAGMDPNIEKALGAARYLHHALHDGGSSAFLWWGLTYADPATIGREGDEAEKTRDEGLVLVDHRVNPMPFREYTSKYHAFKQWSRYVLPGYVRVGLTHDAPLQVTAFVNPAATRMAVVVINHTTEDLSLVVAGAPSGCVFDRVVMTTATRQAQEGWPGAAWTLPASSITTLLYRTPNAAPTGLALSGSTVLENQPAGMVVGTLTATDPDAGDTFTYGLVSGAGDTDNASFTVSGNTLQTASAFNHEAQSSCGVRMRVTDQDGLWFERAFTVTVGDVNEPPTGLALSGTTVNDAAPPGTLVGTFSTTDPDATGTFTYSLTAGSGDTDNGFFAILNDTLTVLVSPDYAAASSLSVRVRATDQGGLFAEQVFTVAVLPTSEEAIVFAAQAVSGGLSEIYSVKPYGSALVNLTSDLTPQAWGPRISPDGRRIAFGSRSIGNEIWVMNANGSGKTTVPVASEPYGPTVCGWLSNQRLFYYSGPASGTGRLRAVDLDGANNVVLVNNPLGGDNNVGVESTRAPATGMLAFVGQVGSSSPTYDVYLADADGANPRLFFADAANNVMDRRPVWSRDGQMLYWAHSSASGTSPYFGVVRKALDSGAGLNAYDAVVWAYDGVTTMPQAVSPNGAELLVSRGNGQLVARSLAGGGDRLIHAAYSMSDADWGLLKDANLAPTDLVLSASQVDENAPAGTVVGSLSTSDPDVGNTFTYSLVSGAGSEDNASFAVDGSVLKTASALDHETKPTRLVRLRTTDQAGLFREESVVITVNNLTPEVFPVTTTADSGPGSLRAALAQANDCHDTARIPWADALGTITPTSPLPAITARVTLECGVGNTASQGLAVSSGGVVVISGGDGSMAGETTVANGTLTLTDNALDASRVTIQSAGTLAGNGRVGELIVATDGHLAPGASPGAIASGDVVWSAGGAYNWEINHAVEAAGQDPGWDCFEVNGVLTITAAPSAQFFVNLVTLQLENTPGPMTGFSPTQDAQWPIVRTTGGIVGFTADALRLNTAGVANPLGGGSFALSVVGNDLVLSFTKPPPTAATLLRFAATTADGTTALIQWTTGAEFDTLGFHLERDLGDGWLRITDGLIPASGQAAPRTYEVHDPLPPATGAIRYRLVEVDPRGRTRTAQETMLRSAVRASAEVVGGVVVLSFRGAPHQTLRVEFAPDLNGRWTSLGRATLDENGCGHLELKIDPDCPRRFYRLIEL